MKISKNAQNAILMGLLCSIAYLAVYFARNVLGTVSPQMIENGVATETLLGNLSSVYFISYAFGQLINGIIGDRIKARYMLSFGLLFAGVTNLIFPYVLNYSLGATVTYAATGFFLSMIYAPMTKIVAENTEPIYTTRCSLGYTLSEFLGSPLAGLVASVAVWQTSFKIASLFLTLMAIACFSSFLAMEKRGLITYNRFKREKKSGNPIKVLLKRNIVKFSLISILTGVVRTAVVFWMPTYIAQYLGFSAKHATLIFTVISFVMATTAFIAIFIYERLNRNMNVTILLLFICSTLLFCATYFFKYPMVNIVFLVLAVMSSNGAATMLWSRYCPSLRDTGMVSSVTGFLDFLSYIAAALSSSIFGNAVATIGWGNLILVWTGLMLVGVFVALPYAKLFKKNKTE